MPSKLPWIFPGIRRPTFSLRQISFRIPTRIPRSFLYIVIYAIVFYIFSGGAYDIVNKDTLIAIGESGNNPVFVSPYPHHQYLIEGLVAGFIFAFAALSLYLFDYATKFAFDVNTAQKLEFLAAILVIIWYVTIMVLFNRKTG